MIEIRENWVIKLAKGAPPLHNLLGKWKKENKKEKKLFESTDTPFNTSKTSLPNFYSYSFFCWPQPSKMISACDIDFWSSPPILSSQN